QPQRAPHHAAELPRSPAPPTGSPRAPDPVRYEPPSSRATPPAPPPPAAPGLAEATLISSPVPTPTDHQPHNDPADPDAHPEWQLASTGPEAAGGYLSAAAALIVIGTAAYMAARSRR
ncbi:hypothetical protein KUM39_24795, partial [Streptomyces sp. J2-1]|nr:hypothetical protein [Streptomyces corallincola]